MNYILFYLYISQFGRLSIIIEIVLDLSNALLAYVRPIIAYYIFCKIKMLLFLIFIVLYICMNELI